MATPWVAANCSTQGVEDFIAAANAAANANAANAAAATNAAAAANAATLAAAAAANAANAATLAAANANAANAANAAAAAATNAAAAAAATNAANAAAAAATNAANAAAAAATNAAAANAAKAAAAANAAKAFAAAAAAVWSEISEDCAELSAGDPNITVPALKRTRLWRRPDGKLMANWNRFVDTITDYRRIVDKTTGQEKRIPLTPEERPINEHWHVWTNWMQARIEGRDFNEALEVERVLIPNADWQKGPRHVNRLIMEIEAKYLPSKTTRPETIRRSPITGLYHAEPTPPAQPDRYEEVLLRVNDALDDLGDGSLGNQYTALAKIRTKLIRALTTRKANKQTVHDEFFWAYLKITELTKKGELPEGDLNLEHLQTTLRNGFTDIEIMDDAVRDHSAERVAHLLRTMAPDEATSMELVMLRKRAASDPELAEDFAEDTAVLTGFDADTADDADRAEAAAHARRAAFRAPQVDDTAVEKDDPTAFAKAVDAADTAGKLHKGVQAADAGVGWIQYLLGIFG